MKKILSFFFLPFLILCGTLPLSAQTTVIRPSQPWPDTDGNPINAHGGNIIKYGHTFYWYGEHRIETIEGVTENGISCYTSQDLLHWKYCGLVLRPNDKGDFQTGCLMERPKVVFNQKTKKFVLLFHHELKNMGYAAAHVAFAVSNTPLGPFKYLRSLRPNARKWPLDFSSTDIKKAQQLNDIDTKELKGEAWNEAVRNGLFLARDFHGGQMSRDMTIFVDDDGKAYHIFASEENQTLHIARLTPDYLDYTGEYVRIDAGGSNEAPCLFKKNGTYWLITSGCTGWAPNRARMFSAKNIFGPWKKYDTPFSGPNYEKTFEGQGAFILENPRQKNHFIFVGDIWNPKQLSISRQLWLPIDFKDNKPFIPWVDNWTFVKSVISE
jgi:beta-xylosidase